MSDLIERVARKAGWRQDAAGDWYRASPATLYTFEDELTGEGLVLLLKELLAAGYDINPYDHGVSIGKEMANGYAASAAATLEEAVCLAYLAHKGER